MTEYLFLIILFTIAILYSSVGHGGASGYLALMAIYGLSPEFMRPSALLLNIFVSSIALYSFYKNGHFKIKLVFPFLLTSVPFAFLGGYLVINPHVYKIILGIFLIFASFRMIYKPKIREEDKNDLNISLALLIGVFLGFFSGLIGIGGGIILSPIILLLRWGNVKETAAASAAFILLNSISGLSGQLSGGIEFHPDILFWVIAGVSGGVIGSYMGSYRISEKSLRYALSFVLLFASLKLIVL